MHWPILAIEDKRFLDVVASLPPVIHRNTQERGILTDALTSLGYFRFSGGIPATWWKWGDR